jgi:hypothetical protein
MFGERSQGYGHCIGSGSVGVLWRDGLGRSFDV